MDSRALDHVAKDLGNLSMYSEYGGPENITVGNGSGLNIDHTSMARLNTSSKPLILSNVLYAPKMKRNFISVAKICQTNGVFIEFFPKFFLMKDLATGAPLMKRLNNNDIYELGREVTSTGFKSSNKNCLLVSASNADVWQRRLGHPSSRVLNYILKDCDIRLGPNNKHHECNSCLSNKSHKLPFNISTLTSSSPLQLLYTNV